MKAVNKERMLAEFKEVVALPCHTLQERPVFELLRAKLEVMGFTVEEDDAGKKLGGNWNTYRDTYINNPLAEDRLNYKVLYHTDLGRTTGNSTGTDLSRLR